MARTGQQYPNSHVAPHQQLVPKLDELDSTWGSTREDRPLNRAERRQYVRNGARNVRKYVVGFGKWRRPRDKNYESNAKLTALPYQQAPRRERRLHDVTRARDARRMWRRSRKVD